MNKPTDSVKQFEITNEIMTAAWGRNADGRARWNGEDLHAVHKIIKAHQNTLPPTGQAEYLKEDVEALVEAVHGLSFGVDWNNGTHAKIYRPKLLAALAPFKPKQPEEI